MDTALEIILQDDGQPPKPPSRRSPGIPNEQKPVKPPFKPPMNMPGAKGSRLSSTTFDKSLIQKQLEEFSNKKSFYAPLLYKDFHYSKIVKEYIIGQDEAIDKLVYIVYHNMHENMMADFYGIDSPRYSAVVVGPSGCGKTASLTRIAELFNVPFVKYNATPLTSGGYVGKCVEDMLTMLISAAGGDMERAQRGILYIDEIDKKVSTNPNNTSGRDINGTSVQEELLKFLEPSIIDLGRGKSFDTHYLTVLMSGRFIDIDKLRKKRLRGHTKMGFTSEPSSEEVYIPVDEEDDDFNEFDRTLSQFYTHQDIIDFGFLDEFVGRIFDVIEFKKLTKPQLVEVILAKGSVLQRFVEELKVKDHELFIDGAIYERIADAAYNSPMGARCIESIINNLLIPAKRDFMHNYRPGIMEYDADGNYSSLFASPLSDDVVIYKHIEGPRAKRRAALQSGLYQNGTQGIAMG